MRKIDQNHFIDPSRYLTSYFTIVYSKILPIGTVCCANAPTPKYLGNGFSRLYKARALVKPKHATRLIQRNLSQTAFDNIP